MIALAPLIDHTLLRADAGPQEIIQLCREAKDYGFASVCVNPRWVSLAAEQLKDSPVKVCTVIGFPLGASSPLVKAFEAAQALKDGAQELDMVIALGALKSGQDRQVLEDIKAVAQAAQGRLLKVIVETCLLSDDEKVRACQLAVEGGAHFVKTSTGFSSGGATVQDVELMRRTVGPQVGVKASGGIRTRETALAMVAAGANRIGASAGVAICAGERR